MAFNGKRGGIGNADNTRLQQLRELVKSLRNVNFRRDKNAMRMYGELVRRLNAEEAKYNKEQLERANND